MIEAESAVVKFITNCYMRSKVYVLVITGKGNVLSDKKTLKTELPNFLKNSAIFPIIISYTEASRKHGHQGAFYILLRKRASKDV